MDTTKPSSLYRLPLLVAAVGVFGSLAFGAIYYGSAHRAAMRDAETAVARVALQSRQVIGSLRIAANFVALTIEKHGTLDGLDLDDELATIRVSLPKLRTMIVLDPDGIVRGDTRPTRPALGVDVADRQYFQDAMKNPDRHLHLGVAVASRVDGHRTIPMSRAVTNESGAVIAVLATSVGAEFFASTPIGSSRPGEAGLFLYETEGSVLTSIGMPVAPAPLHEVALGAVQSCDCDEAAFPMTFVHESRLVTIETAEDGRLYVVGVRPSSDVTAAALGAVAPPIAGGIILSLIGAGALVVLMRKDQQIRFRDDRFSEIASSIPGVIFQYTLLPDGSDRIEHISKGCVRIWEMTAAEIGEDPSAIWRMVHPEDRDEMQRSVMTSARDLSPWSARWRMITPSGAQKVLHGRGRPKRLENGGTVWTSLVLDITDAAEAQAELQRSRAMVYEAQKREAIGQLTGGVAHDFNNLIAVIKGNAELLDEMALEPKAAGLVLEVLAAADQSSDLTRRLLLLGRNAVLAPKMIDLNRSVKEMEPLLRRTLPAMIELYCILDRTPSTVLVDRAQLEAAILNLVLNARDAIGESGRISIETTQFEVAENSQPSSEEALAPGRYARLTVTDTGSGMTPQVLERALDPYFTTKALGEGSGLGLSVVHGFMRQSLGAIELRSTPGIGTVVTLSFPAQSAEIVAAAGAEEASQRGAGRLLLAEDQEQVRRTMARLLTSLGYEVVDVSSGSAALAQFRQDPGFDAVVTDVVMPGGMSGQQLVDAIRQVNPKMPAIYLSGYFERPAEPAPQSTDVDQYLTKPTSRGEISKALHRLLQTPERAES